MLQKSNLRREVDTILNSGSVKLVSDYNNYSIVLVYFIGLISWVLSLIGFYKFFQLNPWYWLFAIPVLMFTLYYVPNYIINFFYRKLNIRKVIEDSISQEQWPIVDIFLPVCGEDEEILKRTWDGVTNLDYPNYNVYVGDDAGKLWVKELANKYGFNYLSRENKGFMKKTGNLKFLFEHSNSEYFVVFDADFCPKPNFLKIALPQIIKSPELGILQTPQVFFEGKNSLEEAASNSQFDFYKIIQNSRNYFDASVCVGSNAIFRRKAIAETKVYDWLVDNKIDHGEDVNTGFYLLSKGYKTRYLPIALATGNSADTVQSLIKQRNRWSSSSTRMFFSGIVGNSNITLMQKICFYTGFFYYLADPFKIVLSYMLFVVLVNHGQNLNILNALWFIPHIIFGLILIPIYRKKMPTFASKAVDLILVYTHIYTIWKRLFGSGANWVPTGKVAKNDSTVNWVKRLFYINLFIYSVVTVILSFRGMIHFQNIQAYTLIFWIFYFIITHLITLYYLSKKAIN
jgi:cellulose synthase/poly-beta-1,6-N-acetylglucosamine synthase-like glycosyltransferase